MEHVVQIEWELDFEGCEGFGWVVIRDLKESIRENRSALEH